MNIRYWKNPKRTDQPVRIVFAWILDDWELDRIANDDEFKIAVPEQTVVAHFPAGHGPRNSGNSSRQPRVELTKEPVPDIREFAMRPGFGERPHSVKPVSSRRFVLSYVTACFLTACFLSLAIIVWLCCMWRRN